MAIASSDIKYKLSIKTGSAGNSLAQADPNASLGKYVSTTVKDQGTLDNNLWDDVTGDENAASDVEYRCIFVHNDHATLTLFSAVIYIASQVSGGTSIAIGLDPAGATAKGSSSAQAAEIADESTAPSGVTFSAPTSKATGLSLGDLAAAEVYGVWIRRTAANTSAVDADGYTLRVAGDTGA